MYSNKKKSLTAASLIVLLLIIDQIIKVTVKLHMNLGEAIHVFDLVSDRVCREQWNGMGMELGSKLFLSIFRIVAVGSLYGIYPTVSNVERVWDISLFCQ